jgi:hypothetical protein
MTVPLVFFALVAAAPADAAAPSMSCDSAALRAARQEFRGLYKSKKFKLALDMLAPAFTRCENELDAGQRARLLSDLAIAAYRSGNRKLCLQFLDRVPGDASTSSNIALAIVYNRRLCRGEAPNPDAINCRDAVTTDEETLCSGRLWEETRKQVKRVGKAAEAKLRSEAKGAVDAWRKEFRRAERTWQELIDVECGPIFTQEFGEWGTAFNDEQTHCEISLLKAWMQEMQNRFALPGKVVEKPAALAPCAASDPHRCPEVVQAEAKRKAYLKEDLASPPDPISSLPDSPAKQIAAWRKHKQYAARLWLRWLDAWCVSSVAAESVARTGKASEPRPVQAMATCLLHIINQRLAKEAKERQPAP